MRELSPTYDKYYTQLTLLNQRVCQEFGYYYDEKFRLRKK